MKSFIGYNKFCAKSGFRYRIKSWRFGRSATVIAVLLLVALFVTFVAPVYHKLDSAEAITGGAVSPVLTFASINPVASVNMIVSSPTGTFATSNEDEKAAFTISTNNYTGYTLVLKSTGNVTNLNDGNSHNISTISSSTTGDVFASDGASGQALNNRWGYIPNYYNASGANPSVNTTTYYPAPTSTNTATLRTTDAANSANGVDNADDYTIGLGFRADYNSPSGTYANDTFVLEFVANPVAFVIQYDKNTTDTVTSMPANQSGTSTQNHITLSSNTPARTHYGFLGWCEGEVTVTNDAITGATKDTCTSTNNIYQPGDDFYFDYTTSNHVTLKAMWEEHYYMQDFTTNMCNSMANALSLTLYDRRDEQDYTIAKIDEECWMTKNLNLAGGTALYSATSNVPSGYDSTPFYTLTTSVDTGYSDNNVAYLYNANNTECSTGQPCYSYYSYVNATAGTYNTSIATGEMEYDICPKGWRLPTADNMRDLAEIYPTDAAIMGAPFNEVYSGRFSNDGFGYGVNVGSGKAGAIVSSTVSSSGWLYKMSNFSLDSAAYPGGVTVDTGETKVGNAVRCVLKYPYLQDQNPASMATLLPNTNDTMIFADKRDNAKYMVGKLADGNYWMMKNLALNPATVSLATLKGNTNASDASLEYLKGVNVRNASTDPDGNFATSGVTTVWADSYSDPIINTESKNSLAVTYGPAAKNDKAKVGIYYNYCTTSAGTYCFGDGDDPGVSVGNNMEDICPKNWRLPTGDAYGEFWQICSAVKGSNCATAGVGAESMNAASPTSLQYHMSLTYSAGFYDGAIQDQDKNGVIWSSTRPNSLNMSYLDYRDLVMYINGANHRRWGLSVRCVLKYPAMQDQTPSTMATMLPNNGDTTILEDKRTSNKYSITKINGDYWMTQNLRINGVVTAEYSNFTGDNVNISASDLTAGDSFTEARTHIGLDSEDNPTTWYNYCAVSAGTVCDDVTKEDAYRDICPAGWRLPNNSENAYVVNYQSLFSPVAGGGWHAGDLIITDQGNWWSSTGENLTNQRGLQYTNLALSLNNFNKDRGRYARCVLEERTIVDITYMQEVTPTIVKNTTEGATGTLIDKRDNTTYTVGKINGDLWMTQNLTLAAGTTLTSKESNVTTSYTIPTTDTNSAAYSATADLTSGNSYTEGRTHTGVDGNSNPTMWYNYCAASAGSVCTNSDAISTSQDICPNGWHLPTGPGTSEGSDLNNLIGNDVSGWQDATVKFNSFGAIAGGFYRYGAIAETENGNWWSSTPHSVENSYLLTYDGTNNRVLGYSHNNRTLGLYIRCVANNTR